MSKSLFISLASVGFFIALTGAVLSDNGKAGYTNSPSEGNCTSCHSGTVNSTLGSVALISDIPATGYVPGTSYNMTLKVKQTSKLLFGLGLEALTSTNQNAGTLVISTPTKTSIKSATVGGVSRKNVVHQFNGGSSTDSMMFAFKWTAPAAGTGLVKFYYSGMAANKSGNTSGDYVYTGNTSFEEYVDHTAIAQAVTNINSFSIFPNPVKERVNVQYSLNSASEVTVSVYTLEGKLVKVLAKDAKAAGDVTESFDLGTSLAKGAYFLELRTEKGVSTQKMMIQ